MDTWTPLETPARFDTSAPSHAPDPFDAAAGFDASAPIDPPAPFETVTGFEPPRSFSGRVQADASSRSGGSAWEPVAAEFWDDAITAPGTERTKDAVAGDLAEDAPAAGAGPLRVSASVPVPRDSTWPDAFVEVPPRTMDPESGLPAAREHDDDQRGAHRTVATGRHSPPALTVVPDTPPASDRDRAAGRDQAGLAVLARQVESARRHLQAAVLVAHDAADRPRLDGLLGAVEQVLAAVTELAQDSCETLAPEVAARTFPGEARFLCAAPWERTPIVAADPYDADQASPAGLARLLVSLGYDAQPVTASTGVVGVQVRSDRYAAHIALVEPAVGGRQRWSGALEWTDADGGSHTWAETLGPVELDEHELAHRVDDLLRRCVGPAI